MFFKIRQISIYKSIRKIFLLFAFFIFCLILFSNLSILLVTHNKIFKNLKDLPQNKVGLLLGTSKYIANTKGANNLFYKERLKAVNNLYEAKKIDILILSGSNPDRYYNEPLSMKKDLLKKGISINKITLDYAGFRTLDSVLRAKEIFKQKKITIISQKFHLQRAVFLARLNGLDALGYIAEDPEGFSFKVYFREIFARIKMLFDILWKVGPKYYGKEIDI